MSPLRALACLLVIAAVGTVTGAASSSGTVPTGLHAFTLRADEPARTSFSRTPSFAWNPVPGADHYEFQLSLSTTFRDNSIVYADGHVLNPVAAPPIALPWISGNPHSLYARVRAIVDGEATAWSPSYGFDMAPPAPPTPLPSYPGLIRWTPVEGAVKYEIWFVDANNEHVFTTTNVLDEREFYAFHQTQNWMGTVRWRIRAWRADPTPDHGINNIPATKWGAWSPVYSSSNPALVGGQIKLLGTVSDVFSDGSPKSPAHRLMPAFLWSGNQTASAKAAELYRVYVFSDKQCLNPVYASPAVASPAYAPRPFGGISMPSSAQGIQAARSSYLPGGGEPPATTLSGDDIVINEDQPSASPTTTPPGAPGASTGAATGSGSSASTPAPPTASGPGVTFSDTVGAPIDLWDTEWPSSGYYWTVIPVAVQAPDQLSTGVVSPAPGGGSTATVASTQGFRVGDIVSLGVAPGVDTLSILSISGNTLTFTGKLNFSHFAGEPVVRSTGTFQYRDLEMAQDVCASGRIARFGKDSEPSLTAADEIFASGLSSVGRLTSARHTTRFYGQPLVSWTAALSAWDYEIQWSKTTKPFTPLGSAITKATSYVLPLSTGTWYYRVRGFDFSLPSGSQQMSWSEPATLEIAKPTFKVVGSPQHTSGAKAPAAKPAAAGTGQVVRKGNGFSVKLPATWTSYVQKDSLVTFQYRNPAKTSSMNVFQSSGRAGRTFDKWASDLRAQMLALYKAPVAASVVTLPAGKAVELRQTITNKTQSFDVVQYFVDAGATAYVVTFTSQAAAYSAARPVFAKMIAGFKLG